MGLLDTLGFRKKKKKPSARHKTTQKTATKQRKTQKKVPDETEAPVITMTRQLTHLQRDLGEIEGLMRSGFQGLHEDHHKILEELFTKKNMEAFKK